jgi:hypothetical protein
MSYPAETSQRNPDATFVSKINIHIVMINGLITALAFNLLFKFGSRAFIENLLE